MILVTVGTMLPFDRLVRTMDVWAAHHPDEEVFAQIGDGLYRPQAMGWSRLLSTGEFAAMVGRCSFLVAHAGTGSFFLAAEKSKPLVMLPRRAALHEHTTDHQVHTARWLREKPGIYVAMEEHDLPRAISAVRARPEVSVSSVGPYAPAMFLAQIRSYLLQ